MTAAWTPDQLRRLAADAGSGAGWRPDGSPATAVITREQVTPLLPGTDFWDLWPVRDRTGVPATVCSQIMWAGLSAPATGDPAARHDQARIRLIASTGTGWADRGPLFPDAASPGSREWAGSLTFDPELGRLFAYYTAAGTRGEAVPTFCQRIMGASARVHCAGPGLRMSAWTEHTELITADGVRYQPAAQRTGRAGFIKAFRDPFRFDDPATGATHLIFTGSLAGANNPEYNGLIGLATACGVAPDGGPGNWQLQDPLIVADGVNNELERPHVVVWADQYYLFFSTQARTFHPQVSGPTGLYGFVGPSLLGPYRPLNSTGLVLRNPTAEPFQAYSWLVLPDRSVSSFVDSYDLAGRHPDELARLGADAVRAHFGGTFAPPLRLNLSGDRAALVAG